MPQALMLRRRFFLPQLGQQIPQALMRLRELRVDASAAS